MMCIRLVELKRVLKETGSIYLHCDPTASHYLKILLDTIFTANNFRNEIVWLYKTGGVSKRYFAWKHDIILMYSKTDKWKFNPQKEKSYLMHKYGFSNIAILKDDTGYYTEVNMRDVWDIPALRGNQPEKMEYPTQKPEALLERIIQAASDENDIVLDPFCGCGTALVTAHRLNRKWIGIDITYLAISAMKWRLDNMFPGIKYKVIGEPKDFESAMALANQDKYQFQWWAVSLIRGQPYGDKKKGADTGIDGYLIFMDEKDKVKKGIISVKSGGVSVSQVRDLIGVVKREKAEMGIFLTLEPATKPMEQEAALEGFYHSPLGKDYPKIQILTIADILNGKKPNTPSWISPIATPLMVKKSEGDIPRLL